MDVICFGFGFGIVGLISASYEWEMLMVPFSLSSSYCFDTSIYFVFVVFRKWLHFFNLVVAFCSLLI